MTNDGIRRAALRSYGDRDPVDDPGADVEADLVCGYIIFEEVGRDDEHEAWITTDSTLTMEEIR